MNERHNSVVINPWDEGHSWLTGTSQCEMWANFKNNTGECTEAGDEDIRNFSLTFFDTQNQKQASQECQVIVIPLVWTSLDCLISICRYIQLTFRHRASCILGQAGHYSPENAFYIFNQQIRGLLEKYPTVFFYANT